MVVYVHKQYYPTHTHTSKKTPISSPLRTISMLEVDLKNDGCRRGAFIGEAQRIIVSFLHRRAVARKWWRSRKNPKHHESETETNDELTTNDDDTLFGG